MLPLIVYVLSALCAVSVIQLCLLICARALNPEAWVLAYVALLGGIATVLSLQWAFAWYPFVNYLILALLLSGGYWFRSFCQVRVEISDRWLVALAALFVVLELLYAAFPAYRYDQLTYHLQVGKVIARYGTLEGPIFQDHFMTGIYEYLFTLPRAVWNDDVFVLCFADAFSVSVYLLLWVGVCRLTPVRSQLTIGAALIFSLTMACLAPEHEAIINAKPDYLFAPIVAMICVVFFLSKTNWHCRSLMLMGYILILPLAFKITWVHTLLALSLPLMLGLLRRRFPHPRPLVIGALFATVPLIIVLQKNFAIYGNPVHPMQIGLWKSAFWTEEWAAYWRLVAGKATDMSSYFSILFQVCVGFPLRYLQVLLVAATLTLYARWTKRRMALPLLFVLLSLLCFILSWPLFYKGEIFSRFVASCYGLLGILMLMRSADLFSAPRARTLVLLVWLVPLLTLSKHDIHMIEFFSSWLKSPQEYFANTRDPLRFQSGYFAINKAIAERGLDPRAVSVFANDNNGYFLNANLFTVPGNQNRAYEEAWLRGHEGFPCLFAYMFEQQVFFVFDTDGDFMDWPEPYARLASLMQPLNDDPRIFFIDPNKLKDLSKNEMICQLFKLKI